MVLRQASAKHVAFERGGLFKKITGGGNTDEGQVLLHRRDDRQNLF